MPNYRYFTLDEYEKYKQVAEENGIKGYTLPLGFVCTPQDEMPLDSLDLDKYWPLSNESNNTSF